MNVRDESTSGVFSVFRVEKVLNEWCASEDGLQKAADELNAIRAVLLRETCLVRMSGDVDALNKTEGGIFRPWLRKPFVAPLFEAQAAMKKPALARDFFAKDAIRPAAG